MSSLQGLSIKEILHSERLPSHAHSERTMKSNLDSANRNDCFYGICQKSTYCGGYITCGEFKTSKNKLYCFFFTVMTISLFFSVIIPVVLYRIADKSINDEVVIDSTSAKNYEVWKTNTEGAGFRDYKVHYDLYYFDIQNPDGVLKGEKPVLVEVGPYAYNEYFKRFDITWTDDGDTVTFYNQRFYVFDQSRSGAGLTESDDITLPYPTISGFQHILDKIPLSASELAGEAIDSVLFKTQLAIEGKITDIYDQVVEEDDHIFPPDPAKHAKLVIIENQLKNVNDSVKALYDQIFEFTGQSNPLDLFMKGMMCETENGVTPFFKGKPSPAWFGWNNDPLLLRVANVIHNIEAKTDGLIVPWTNTVPGITVNWTTPQDLKRRMMPGTYKTGKKNPLQVGQYVKYNNMVSMYNCILPMHSQKLDEYEEGVEAPACAHFDENWSHEEAVAAGYMQPFDTPYSNRIQGTDGNMFGRPVRTEKLQIFSFDIYRSGFMQYKGDVTDWHGITLRRFGIQPKDMYNSTLNPENVQYYANGISGVENLTQALNIPVYASFPHFLYGDSHLVDSCVGLHPNELAHTSQVDLEPQTGLIARATKRIQVNYLMKNTYLPQANSSTLDKANEICATMQNVLALMAAVNITTNVTISCNLTILTPLMQCMSTPSDWKFSSNSNDGVGSLYVPYGWVQEGIVMPKSTADQLNETLFAVDDVAAGVRFWCLIIAGVCFTAIIAMLWNTHNTELSGREIEGKYQTKMTGGNEPLLRSSLTNIGDPTLSEI